MTTPSQDPLRALERRARFASMPQLVPLGADALELVRAGEHMDGKHGPSPAGGETPEEIDVGSGHRVRRTVALGEAKALAWAEA